jgi:hypothetical protein
MSETIPLWQRVVFGIVLPMGILCGALGCYLAALPPKFVGQPWGPGWGGTAGDVLLEWLYWIFAITFYFPMIIFTPITVVYTAFRFPWKHWVAAFFGGLSAILAGVILGGIVMGLLKVLSD